MNHHDDDHDDLDDESVPPLFEYGTDARPWIDDTHREMTEAIASLPWTCRSQLGAAANAAWARLRGEGDELPMRALFWFDLAQTFYACDAAFLLGAVEGYIEDRPYLFDAAAEAPTEPDHAEIRALVVAAVEQLYEGSFEARMHAAVLQLGDRAEALGRSLVAFAGSDDPERPRADERPLWLAVGEFLVSVADEQRVTLEELRIDVELDNDPVGEIVEEGGEVPPGWVADDV